VDILLEHFDDHERESRKLLTHGLVMPAYEQCVKANHCFNLLDARGVVSVTEKAGYIARVRALAKSCCQVWLDMLKEEGCHA
jgi:glycyl-tRNA synthetase alpha chain